MADRDWVELRVNEDLVELDTDFQVRHVEIDRGTNSPAQAVTTLADPDLVALARFPLGAEIDLRLRDDRGQLRKLFVGEVTEVGMDETHDEPCLVTVTALDRSHRLSLATAALSTQKLTPSDVVKRICSDAGLTSSCPSLGAEVPYLLLTASAHQIITELVTRAGHAWRYDAEKRGLVVSPIPTEAQARGQELAFGTGLYRLHVAQSARAVNQAEVRGWDPARGQTIVGTARAKKPRGDLVGGAETWAGQSTVLLSGQPVLDQAEADTLAQSVVTTAQRRSVTVRGQAVLLPDLVPNTWITVSGGTKPGNRSYYVDRVVHRYTPGRGRTVSTSFEGGNHPHTTPLSGLSSTGSVPLRADALVVGVVTNNNDPEGLGRVRLKFPWLSDADESNWARVTSFGGGAGDRANRPRGSQFVPEVNDEVVAGFENGDLRRPVVLGTLYSPRTKAPVWQRHSDKVNTRSITSRLGHVVEFSDGQGPADQFIRLTLAKEDTEVRLSDERVAITAPSGHEIEMTAGDTTVTFDKSGGILLKGRKVVIDATEVEIKAKASIKAEAATVEAKGKGQLKLEGALVDVKGSGMTKIAGGQVMIN